MTLTEQEKKAVRMALESERESAFNCPDPYIEAGVVNGKGACDAIHNMFNSILKKLAEAKIINDERNEVERKRNL